MIQIHKIYHTLLTLLLVSILLFNLKLGFKSAGFIDFVGDAQEDNDHWSTSLFQMLMIRKAVADTDGLRYSSLLNSPSVVTDGNQIMSFPIDSHHALINFTSWGKGQLSMTDGDSEDDPIFKRIFVRTENESAGFQSGNLDVNARYIALTIADISKSRDSQLSFSLEIESTNPRAAYRVILVNGPLNLEGWNDRIYYMKINPYSSQILDLNSILSSRSEEFFIKKINIVVQNETSLTAAFRLALFNNTEANVPQIGAESFSYYRAHMYTNYT